MYSADQSSMNPNKLNRVDLFLLPQDKVVEIVTQGNLTYRIKRLKGNKVAISGGALLPAEGSEALIRHDDPVVIIGRFIFLRTMEREDFFMSSKVLSITLVV